jgi:leader peptidase (prepilin peptidase) / N-methyltransferase
MIDTVLLYVVVFAAGAAVGSFLNVCIHRIPSAESIVFPASHCPSCNTPIRAYDNVPLLSYVWLLGRCRDCKARISARYPLVELLGAVAALAAVAAFGPTPRALISFAFLSALIVVTFIDLDYQIIPDPISLPGIGVGFLAAILLGDPSWKSSLIGILAGGGVLWAVAEGYHWLTGREGMGGGDIKLLAMIGAFLGWRAVPITLLIGSLSGTFIGLALMLLQGRDSRTPIPFGPFLAIGAVCALFFGNSLIAWYLSVTAP